MAESSTKDRLIQELLFLSNVVGPRPAGSKANDQALAILQEKFVSLGLRCEVETFKFTGSEIDEWSFRVDGMPVPSIPCVSSPSTDGNVSAPIIDVGYGSEEELGDVSGKIVLAKIGKVHESIKAESAAKKGALGALFYATEERWGIYTGRMQYPIGSIPALCISSRDAMGLTRHASREVRVSISVKARTKEMVGKNLVTETDSNAEDYVVVTAHRDSRPHSPGANDNASGSVSMVEAARILAEKRLRRRVVFISPDAEEYGLRGSMHYVQVHRNDLVNCVGNVNLDSTAQGRVHVLERDRSGPLSESVNSLVIEVAEGMNIRVKRMVSQNGSDCDSFMNAGVQACWIRGWPNVSFNSTMDTFEKLDYALVAKISKLAAAVTARLADPASWKVARKTSS